MARDLEKIDDNIEDLIEVQMRELHLLIELCGAVRKAYDIQNLCRAQSGTVCNLGIASDLIRSTVRSRDN
jgi:hypothetical protein